MSLKETQLINKFNGNCWIINRTQELKCETHTRTLSPRLYIHWSSFIPFPCINKTIPTIMNITKLTPWFLFLCLILLSGILAFIFFFLICLIYVSYIIINSQQLICLSLVSFVWFFFFFFLNRSRLQKGKRVNFSI